MIIQFSCRNYKSIKEEITLSMLASKDSTYEETLYKFNDKIRILPSVSIYGANGAGKTNIINALGYINFLVGNSIKFQHGDNLPFFPHKLNENDENTSMEIQFIKNNNRYAYGFKINNTNIVEEFLYHFPKGKQARIFERVNEDYRFNSSYNKEFNELKESKTKSNRLFLSTAASWSNLNEIIEPFIFLKDDLIVNENLENNSWLHYTIDKISKDKNTKELFLNLLKDLNIGISGIDSKTNVKRFKPEDLPNEIPEEIKMLISKGDAIESRVNLIYGNMKIDLPDESRGIQKIFEIGGPILDVLLQGKVLVFDELETSLHPTLVVHLIKLFRNPQINRNNAQIIFTTHDTNLLDLEIFRRDQIWLAEKNLDDYGTDLYSLSNLKDIRKDENVEKGYIRGKYGAVPFIGNSLITNWLDN